MKQRRRIHPSTVRATVDRLSWPLVVLMLAATVVTISLATQQTQSTSNAYKSRDRAASTSTSGFVATYLKHRFSENADFLTANRDAFQPGKLPTLRDRIDRVYLAYSPAYVRGAVVTYKDGSIAYAGHAVNEPRLYANAQVLEELSAVARTSIGRGVPSTSGLLVMDGHRLYAHATPLTGVSSVYGSWISLYDIKSSPIGEFFARDTRGLDARPTILDDRGRVVAGPQVSTAADQMRVPVPGTRWTIAVPRTKSPQGVPLWVFLSTIVGMALLGAMWWLQESNRRALTEESRHRSRQVERLYSLASDLLHSESLAEQAAFLAASLHDATDVDAVRVRIAELRDDEGVVAGVVPNVSREYRLAVCGPRSAIGELVMYRHDRRVDEDDRHTARTMAAISGAAMHTLSVLERERSTALELQRIDELRTNLLSTVAHELRSPLTAVKGVLGLLSMQNDLSPKAQEYVEVAEVRTDALVALIRDLFDTSLIESGQLDIRPERCVADELLERSLGALAASRPGEVILSATPNLKMTVDPLRFDQIVNNLVTNAFRHGAPPVVVELRPYRDGTVLVVSDDGPGIKPEERDRIFSKFYQSDSGPARLVEGAGLGLALVQGLVRLHGGHIDVDSVRIDGRGGRFTVYFPDVVADVPAMTNANYGRRHGDVIAADGAVSVPDVPALEVPDTPEGDAASGW